MTERMGVCAIIPRGQNGFQPRVFGMGILVTETEVVTCAHVIDEALGLNGQEPANQAVVSMCFPFAENTACVEGIVDLERWFPPTKKKGRSDISVICLQEPAPSLVECAVFQKHSNTKHDDVEPKVYGFRSHHLSDEQWESHPTGEFSLGKVVGSLPAGRGQFEGLAVTGAAIQHGFSGAGI